MGQITSGIGLVSGINSGQIITQLLALEGRPVNQLQTRIASNNAQKSAFTGLKSQIDALKTVGTTLTNPTSFQAAATDSSDPTVLTASAASGAATGTYQLQVTQLVSSQQAISGGFADPNQTKVGAGTITIGLGGGELTSQTALSVLNGGTGVRRGVFRITDRSGKSQAIDISTAVTLDDVLKKINTALDITVRATAGKNGIVLTDQTGDTTHKLVVQDLGDGHAAEDLGIVGNVAANSITGTTVNTIGHATALSQLSDGRGVRTADSGDDFSVQAGDGTTFNVNLGAAKTVAQVLDSFNHASGGAVTATISDDGSGFTLTDNTNSGTITVTALNHSNAAADLGIAGTGGGGTLVGKGLVASLDSTLISSLRGGTGIPLGRIGIVDRAGELTTLDLSHAVSVQDIVDQINNVGLKLTASVNNSSGGIQINDGTGGAGSLRIYDIGSTTAAALGIAGVFNSDTVNGANLHRQYISSSTLLSDYNGGKGVTPGKFTITSSTVAGDRC